MGGADPKRGWRKLGMWHAQRRASPAPSATGSVADVHWGPSRHEGGCENAPHKEGLMQKDLNPCFFIRCPEPRPLHTGRGHSEGSAALCLFHQPDNCCLTASAQPLDLRLTRLGAGRAPSLRWLRSPVSPGLGVSMQGVAWE